MGGGQQTPSAVLKMDFGEFPSDRSWLGHVGR